MAKKVVAVMSINGRAFSAMVQSSMLGSSVVTRLASLIRCPVVTSEECVELFSELN